MSRLSRAMKREQKQAADAATPAPAPIDVRVPEAGAGAGGASVGGVPVVAEPGQEIQQAVLNRLHRIALATGHPVHATVHDERIGYVVPLLVAPDGSSRFTADPVATEPDCSTEPGCSGPVTEEPVEDTVRHDVPTQVLRPAREPVRDAAPTFPFRPVPESGTAAGPVPAFEPLAAPDPVRDTPPGTVAPPTGEFGPPPIMDTPPAPGTVPSMAPQAVPEPEPPRAPQATREPTRSHQVRAPRGLVPDLGPGPDLDPDPGPAPARGFDAVAEAVLGDEPLTAPGQPPALLAEPVGRINEAVKAGRIETATRLAQDTVAQASATLGPEHPAMLGLRELDAYVAYLAGDPVRAFRVSLDLALIHRRGGDAEAAYGNVWSAATAWRAVRDPLLGLELGGELIGLWTELAAEEGPAADEPEELESARARMGRLTARARDRRS
ncbi:tetratricopeptide repeat protein [Streptomyces bullii]|uniref:Tetratricopeptide repeat protein n=1 Tax=Streptomyces bullii TaxID=349910 RepID=A0ABW0UX51_9ACTN